LFPIDFKSIQDRIKAIDPKAYAKSRNFADGKVSKLSPYISRGVISTKAVMHSILDSHGFNATTEKYIQELAWRDYWQLVWAEKNINKDLKKDQEGVENYEIPNAIIEANTTIDAVDKEIEQFYESGYMHNHMRMYVAFMACNLGKSHWLKPAKWMYYHLLDGDWASNALSWQWVAGSNSNKKYIANQENINKYFYSTQRGSYLDLNYEALSNLNSPMELQKTANPIFTTPLDKIKSSVSIDKSKPTLIYNYYNLDPQWHKGEKYNRILLLEPSIFEEYPIGERALMFAIALSENIPNMQVFVGEFNDLLKDNFLQEVIFKEHPLNFNYRGIKEERDWMVNIKGYYPSFFKFWNKAKKEIKNYASN
jgi:deoxyribodipyrimidine photo-lyase